jgi:VCBS repeat-containing protein
VVPNTPPTAVDDGYSATAGVTLSVSEADGVLANDSDPDDPMTAELLTSTSHGSITLNSDGSFDYTSNPTFFGQDSFTYRVNAGSATASATVRITVNLPTGG